MNQRVAPGINTGIPRGRNGPRIETSGSPYSRQGPQSGKPCRDPYLKDGILDTVKYSTFGQNSVFGIAVKGTWAAQYNHASFIKDHKDKYPLETQMYTDLLSSIPDYISFNTTTFASVIMTFEKTAKLNAQKYLALAVADFYSSSLGMKRPDPTSWFDRIFTGMDVKSTTELPNLFLEATIISRSGPQVINRELYTRLFGEPEHPWIMYPILNLGSYK
jgi:hypothetical protein